MTPYDKVVQTIANEIQGQANWQDLLETSLDGLRADVVNQYIHLSDEQLDQIAECAFEQIITDCTDQGYLKDCLRNYVEKMSIAQQLEAIAGDTELQKGVLGFDPMTGEEE